MLAHGGSVGDWCSIGGGYLGSMSPTPTIHISHRFARPVSGLAARKGFWRMKKEVTKKYDVDVKAERPPLPMGQDRKGLGLRRSNAPTRISKPFSKAARQLIVYHSGFGPSCGQGMFQCARVW